MNMKYINLKQSKKSKGGEKMSKDNAIAAIFWTSIVFVQGIGALVASLYI